MIPLLAVLLAAGQVFFPFIPMQPSGKAVAGPANTHTLFGVKAHRFYNWYPCHRLGELGRSPACISLYESDYFSDVQIAAEECKGGVLMLWNEPGLAGVSADRQARLIRRVSTLTNCAIVVGGWVMYSPQQGEAFHHPAALVDAYRARYRTDPPIVGFHFHAYAFTGRDYVDDTRRMAQACRDALPGAEVWITESGSLEGAEQAREAMKQQAEIGSLVDWVFWFISQDTDDRPGQDWDFTALYDQAGNMTPLGWNWRMTTWQ